MHGVVLHESANPVTSVTFGIADRFVQLDYAQCVRCDEVGKPRIRRGHADTRTYPASAMPSAVTSQRSECSAFFGRAIQISPRVCIVS